MDITLLYDSSHDSNELFKYCLLYYDKTTIELNYDEGFPLYDQSNIEYIKNTCDKSIVKFTTTETPSWNEKDFERFNSKEILSFLYDLKFNEQTEEIINRCSENFAQQFAQQDEDFIEKSKKSLASLAKLNNIDYNEYCNIPYEIVNETNREMFVSSFYINYYNSYFNKINSGINCVSCNEYLNQDLIKFYSTNNDINIKNEAFKIFFPNLNKLSFEDILEIRIRLNDELLEMRSYINNLSTEYQNNGIDKLKSKINSSIKQLENKIFDLKADTLQKMLRDLKNPLSYTPFITTFFANIPTHISLIFSIGLISIDTMIEYQKNNRELKTNPVYFYAKLRKHLNF